MTRCGIGRRERVGRCAKCEVEGLEENEGRVPGRLCSQRLETPSWWAPK